MTCTYVSTQDIRSYAFAHDAEIEVNRFEKNVDTRSERDIGPTLLIQI